MKEVIKISRKLKVIEAKRPKLEYAPDLDDPDLVNLYFGDVGGNRDVAVFHKDTFRHFAIPEPENVSSLVGVGMTCTITLREIMLPDRLGDYDVHIRWLRKVDEMVPVFNSKGAVVRHTYYRLKIDSAIGFVLKHAPYYQIVFAINVDEYDLIRLELTHETICRINFALV